MSEIDSRVNTRGFSKESCEIVREMEDFGWTFRPSNHGVVGRAPNDKTTISISRKLRKSNHSYQKAWADFRRWLRAAHPELVDVAEKYVDDRIEAEKAATEASPVVGEILERRTITRAAQQLEAIQAAASETQTENEEAPVSTATVTENPTVTDERPMHLRKSKDDIVRALKRTWSNGRVDFRCAYEGCLITSDNPRSITQHYGAVHTRPAETYTIAAPKPVAAVEAEPAVEAPEVPDNVYKAIELAPDTEPEESSEPEPTPTPALMVMAIQGIVSRPLLLQMKALAEQVERLVEQNEVLAKERDEARGALAKIESDWDALRALLGNR